MKKIFYILPFAIMLTSCEFFGINFGEPGENDTTIVVDEFVSNPNYLFDMEALPVITLTVTEENWNQYLTNFDEDEHNSKYVPAAFSFEKGDTTFYRDSVGLRPRGNTSRRRPEGATGEMHNAENPDWHHAHFGIKFTEYESGERFFGADRVYLKWFKDDAAYCREVYSYDLFRRFGVWSAPRVSYCRVYLRIEGDAQPANFGVYALIEGVRKGYLSDRTTAGLLPDKDGFLWKCAWGADLSSPNISKMGVEEDGGPSFAYDLKTNDEALTAAQDELCDFINNLCDLPAGSDELHTWLEQSIDVDLFLRALAVNVMVGMWDDYWVNQNNYQFYFDATQHKFYFIPYDYDNTLGTSNNINPGTQDPLNWGARDNSRQLVYKVLSIPEYEDRYVNYLHELAEGEFSYEASTSRIRKWQAMISPYVSNDTEEDMEIGDKPADWGNYHQYRILSGGIGNGENTESNFFKTKINSLPEKRIIAPDQPETGEGKGEGEGEQPETGEGEQSGTTEE